MTNWKSLAVCAAVLAALWLTQASAQRGDKKKEGPEPAAGKDADLVKKAGTQKAEKKPFKIELAVKGVLESDDPVEVAYRPTPVVGLPYAPGPLIVRKAVAHGAKVSKGDELVSFDTRKIDQAIGQMELDLKVLDAGIKLAQEEQPLLEKSVPIDMAAAERAKRESDEDLAFFLKTDRPEAEKRAHRFVKFVNFYMEYAKEQLRQLEKMYKSQDLTEDTEQIILKRQRFWVEEAINDLRVAELERDHLLKTTLPRRELALREGVVKQSMALEKARNTLGPMVSAKQNSLVKMHFDRDRLQSGLETLRKDRAAMTVQAPADGVVYYGKLAQGHWDSAGTLAGKLVPHGVVMPDDVLMTIVKTRPLSLRLQIDEKDVHLVKANLAGKAKMTFNPDVKLPAKVTSVTAMPTAPGKFEARIALEIGDRSELMPGMASTVHFVPYSKKLALVVPAGAVYEEDDKSFIDVLKDGKRAPSQVTPGRSHDGHTEILDGLVEGQEFFPDRGIDKKSMPSKGGSEE